MADLITAQISARARLTKNGSVIYDQAFKMNPSVIAEYSADRFVLATSSGWQQVNMGGVVTGKFLSISSDRPIEVSLDGTTKPWNLGRGTMGGTITLIGSFTAVHVQNLSATNQAIVNTLISDEV